MLPFVVRTKIAILSPSSDFCFQLINSFRNAMITRFEHELKKSELDKVDEKKMSTKRGLKAKY